MADSGRLVKMDVDYSEIVDRRLPELQELAKVIKGAWEHCACAGNGSMKNVTFVHSNNARYGWSALIRVLTAHDMYMYRQCMRPSIRIHAFK